MGISPKMVGGSSHSQNLIRLCAQLDLSKNGEKLEIFQKFSGRGTWGKSQMWLVVESLNLLISNRVS